MSQWAESFRGEIAVSRRVDQEFMSPAGLGCADELHGLDFFSGKRADLDFDDLAARMFQTVRQHNLYAHRLGLAVTGIADGEQQMNLLLLGRSCPGRGP